MDHIYFTALPDGAGLAAELAAGDSAPRVYAVEPTGAFENDPNVTERSSPATRPGPPQQGAAPGRRRGGRLDPADPVRCRPGVSGWPRSARTRAARSSTRSRRVEPSIKSPVGFRTSGGDGRSDCGGRSGAPGAEMPGSRRSTVVAGPRRACARSDPRAVDDDLQPNRTLPLRDGEHASTSRPLRSSARPVEAHRQVGIDVEQAGLPGPGRDGVPGVEGSQVQVGDDLEPGAGRGDRAVQDRTHAGGGEPEARGAVKVAVVQGRVDDPAAWAGGACRQA